MRKATYHAPQGDNKVVEMGGVTFFDGQAVKLNDNEHAHLINKLPGNQHFEIEVDDGEVGDAPDLDGMKIADLRSMAEDRGIDHSSMSKAELRDALK